MLVIFMRTRMSAHTDKQSITHRRTYAHIHITHTSQTHLCSRVTVSLRGSNIRSVRSVRLRTSRMHDMMSYRALRFSSASWAACVLRECVNVCV